ncbi:MAG: 2-oxoacid:acceptor oxidoreductase family protein [Limnochordaceae bacterium]|nr:2-oxoacid:acceptor oxidoreductase family protein [Limnochordaceae bacterium]
MDQVPQLPVTNSLGFYEIRFESIGGLGAHLAGQMLAEAAVLRMGLNGAHFSSYGSEKKGSPVKSFVRVCAPTQQVRTNSPVERPHMLVVFHERLLRHKEVLSGLYPDSIVLVNTAHTLDEMKKRLGLASGTVAVVDALKIAVEEKTRVNTAMLGAIARLLPFLESQAMRDTIRATFEHRYPQLVEANLRTFDRGYNEVQKETLHGTATAQATEFVRARPQLGYVTAPVGGVIVNPGNNVLKDLSAYRSGFIPAFDRTKCIDCGQCDLVCPDFCFVWEKTLDKRQRPVMSLKGIDYQYCKGCLKCVEACPADGALTSIREVEGYAEEHTVKHSWIPASRHSVSAVATRAS